MPAYPNYFLKVPIPQAITAPPQTQEYSVQAVHPYSPPAPPALPPGVPPAPAPAFPPPLP